MSLSSTPEEARFLLSTLPAGPAQKRLALGVALALVLAMLAAIPFAQLTFQGSEPLLAAYTAAVLVNELITAALLLAMYSVQRSQGLLMLAVAYLFSAFMVVPWGLTFPGVFSQNGLLDAGLQSTATIAAIRRVGFPLLLLLYGLTRRPAPDARGPQGSPAWRIAGSVAAVALAAVAVTALSIEGGPLLPQWMADERQIAMAWQYVPPAAIVLCLAAAACLAGSRPRSVLDLWLLVVLLSVIIEIVLLGYISGGTRFSLGWWAGRLYGLAASSIVLLVLLSETVALYVRLARALMAERRSREARLSTLEILSASIAHEVNQPLGSMVTNADAALRWLDRAQPDLAETRAALQRIAKDGHRAGQVIESVRGMFRKGPGARAALDLNALLAEALSRTTHETKAGRLTVQTDFAADLPRVAGDALNLGQVACNLFANAIEAMAAVTDRPHVLRISTRRAGPATVQVSVEDSGPGLSAEARQRLFQPFFTTKAEGLGMGLLFCRSVIESHGGRLWADDNAAEGAIFHFTLPADDDVDPQDRQQAV